MEYAEEDRIGPAYEQSGPTTQSLPSSDHATIVSSNSEDKTYGFDTGGIAVRDNSHW